MASKAKRKKSRSRSRVSKSQRRTRPQNGAVPRKVRREILREVASGRTAIEVAAEYGVHNTTISRWKREEKERRSSGRRELPERSRAGGEETTAAPVARAEETTEAAVSGGEPTTPARETGRYSRAFKEEVLKQVFAGRKIVEVARQYTLPDRTLHRWLGEWENGGGEVPEAKTTRPHASGPSPINEEHRALVLSLKAKHANMGLAQVQNQLKRFHAVKLSRHMIARIFKEAGIPLEKRRAAAGSDPSENRFEMTRPGELWAVDFKEFWIHSEKVYALFVLDDFSRFCVGFALTQKPSAELAIGTVSEAMQRYGRPERILSDRGPQFHAWNGVSRFDEFLADFVIEHSVTKAKHAFTNGKLEAFNRSIEAELLDVEEFSSIDEAREKIAEHIRRYNFFRTHMGIAGLVPADRFFGMVGEARRALEEGLRKVGPGLGWLGGLVSEDGAAFRRPTILQLVLRGEKLELLVLGRRFTLSK